MIVFALWVYAVTFALSGVLTIFAHPNEPVKLLVSIVFYGVGAWVFITAAGMLT
jgi:hypothetical protein